MGEILYCDGDPDVYGFVVGYMWTLFDIPNVEWEERHDGRCRLHHSISNFVMTCASRAIHQGEE